MTSLSLAMAVSNKSCVNMLLLGLSWDPRWELEMVHQLPRHPPCEL